MAELENRENGAVPDAGAAPGPGDARDAGDADVAVETRAGDDYETPEQRAEREWCSPIAGFGEQPEKGKGPVHYGGQAVIEGVMMRGPERVATAVRLPSGEIAVHAEEFIPATRKNRMLRLPVIRGGVTLIESLMLGIKALNYSAGLAMEDAMSPDEETALAADAADEKVRSAGVTVPDDTPAAQVGRSDEEGAAPQAEPREVPPRDSESDWKTKTALTGTMLFAFALGIVFFFWIPLVLTDFIMNRTGAEGGVLFNLIDGVIRVVFFLAYIWGISLWGEMRRVFEYHGAEHKTIFMQEAGDELTVENARKYATRHPRCGTSFLLIVMVVSILVFMIFGRPENILERLFRICLIPVIAGISYEFMKLSAKFNSRWWARAMSGPGIWLQSITTKQPSDDQVAVAIASLEAVLVDDSPPEAMKMMPAGTRAATGGTSGMDIPLESADA